MWQVALTCRLPRWFRASINSSVATGDKVVIALANCNRLLLPITPAVATVGMWQLFWLFGRGLVANIPTVLDWLRTPFISSSLLGEKNNYSCRIWLGTIATRGYWHLFRLVPHNHYDNHESLTNNKLVNIYCHRWQVGTTQTGTRCPTLRTWASP